MPNRLAESLSPYLRQHAGNPVDWWPWCDEAFDEARERDVPVLLSVGYAACHWCHVMAHESFEDPTTADEMNTMFVTIKVDREERPDIDSVYMAATQALTGQGGWPMTVFLDHDRRAFHAGTYFPSEPRHGMPSFRQVLHGVSRTWRTNRPLVRAAAERVESAVQGTAVVGPTLGPTLGTGPHPEGERAQGPPTAEDLGRVVERLAGQYDHRSGGFGGAPKFPPALVCEFLLRADALGPVAGRDGKARAMVAGTCAAMARGGMYDQLAGGFARYSVDAAWVVPHFEKMLYDNALLARAYLHWWRATGDPLGRRVVEETLTFLVEDLGTPEGGFASALDADSDGREGAAYVWTPQQLDEALGEEDGRWVAGLCRVSATGTFERGASVLQMPAEPSDAPRWARCRSALLDTRRARPQPARDDKVVTAWNGLAIAALAEAGVLLDRADWIEAAQRCAALLVDLHRDPITGRLARISRAGRVGWDAPGVLEDYADLAEGLLALYQATGATRWFEAALDLLEVTLARFRAGPSFYDTADDAPPLVHRPAEPTDGVTPAGWSALAQALLTSAALGGPDGHRAAAEAAWVAMRPIAEQVPRFAGWAWSGMAAWAAGPTQVAVVAPPGRDEQAGLLHRVALGATDPGLVVALGRPDQAPVSLLRHRAPIGDRATAYPCRGFVCDLPVTDPADLRRALQRPGA